MSINGINSLSHTKWNCKYHNIFALKYQRKVFYREKRVETGKILRQLCEWRELCGHSREERKPNCRAYKESTERR